MTDQTLEMSIFKQSTIGKLMQNGSDDFQGDHPPVARIFEANTRSFWALSAISPKDPSLLWGAVKLLDNPAEIGQITLEELYEVVKNPNNKILIEEDAFNPKGFPLSNFAPSKPASKNDN